MAEIAKAGETIDPARAFALMASIIQDGKMDSMTLHTVVFEPNKRRFSLKFAHGDATADKSEPVSFDLAEVLPERK